MNTANSELLIFDTQVQDEQEYWIGKLSHDLGESGLLPDYGRSRSYSNKTDVVEFKISGELYQKLNKLAGNSPFLLYTALLAALKICLYKYTRNNTIVVGSPALQKGDGTPSKPNALAIVNEVNDCMSFKELILEIRESLLEAYARQTYPFYRLVADLGREIPEDRCPLFNVVVTLKEIHGELPDLRTDIDIVFAKETDELHCYIGFGGRLFARESIERFSSHFVKVISEAIGNPNLLLRQISMLTDSESRSLLVETNVIQKDYSSEKGVHELFEAQAARSPEAIAVKFQGEHLSYRELDERANQVAHLLRSAGVGPESIVGIMMERSVEMVLAILGVLKSGGAYLPLDPSYPQQRLSFMIADAGVRVALTQERLLGEAEAAASASSAVEVAPLGGERLQSQSREPLRSQVSPDNLAYVIYTSGSTGQPKGVMVTHRNVSRLLSATHDWFGFSDTDTWTMFHSFAFDFSVWELWGALCHGGRLVVVPYHLSRSPQEFYQLLVKEGVTVLNQTPSAFSQLALAEQALHGQRRLAGRGLAEAVQEAGEGSIGGDRGESEVSVRVVAAAGELSLRLAIFGGEALDLQSLQSWVERHGDSRPRLVNMYGITETTVHVTSRPVVGQDIERRLGSVIGERIPDLQFYVLGAGMEPAPLGVADEIYVGGAGLARGYLGRADLTAERFVPHPYEARGGERLYRTGDVARRKADGDVEYLGRADAQVKIRGFRIELGEIEAELSAQEGVSQAVVVVRESEGGDSRLVAYVVGEPGQELDAMRLKRALAERLPEYMAPSVVMALEEMPLTQNGKVDRRALPAPERSRLDLQPTYIAPQTEMELVIAGIWKEVLNVESVGIRNNFFDLGGHSLLIAKAQIRLREATGREVPIVDLFTYPTIEALAKRMSEEPGEESSFQSVQDRIQKQKISLSRQRQLAQKRRANSYE